MWQPAVAKMGQPRIIWGSSV